MWLRFIPRKYSVTIPRREVRDSGWQGWVRVNYKYDRVREIKRGGEKSNKEVLLRENTVYPWIKEGEGERA